MLVSIEYFDTPMVKHFLKENEKRKPIKPKQKNECCKALVINAGSFVRSKDDYASIAALVIENKPEHALWGKGQVAGHVGYRVDFSVDLWKKTNEGA